MLKHEDWPGLEKITALRGFERDGSMRHIAILTGNGGLFLDFEMERGADGAKTGYAFPEMLVDVVKLSAAGKRDEAHDLFDAHLPYLRYEQQQGPLGLAVRKYVLMRRGILASDAQRKPALSLSAQAKAGGRLPAVPHRSRRQARCDHKVVRQQSLWGPYVVGWIREVTNSYEAGLYFLGGLALVAGVLTLIIVNARFGEARKTGV